MSTSLVELSAFPIRKKAVWIPSIQLTSKENTEPPALQFSQLVSWAKNRTWLFELYMLKVFSSAARSLRSFFRGGWFITTISNSAFKFSSQINGDCERGHALDFLPFYKKHFSVLQTFHYVYNELNAYTEILNNQPIDQSINNMVCVCVCV